MNINDKLQHKKSLEIINNINKFVFSDFKSLSSLPKTEISKTIQDFISSQTSLFFQIWSSELKTKSSKLEIYSQVIDLLEENILGILYNSLFCSTVSEIEEDYRFELLVDSLQFLPMERLDAERQFFDEVYFELAIQSLKKINQYKSPKEKIYVIINYCKIITQMVKDLSHSPIGADEVIPILIYGIIQANVSKLKSNLEYIKNFRHESRLDSEEEYNLTHVETAISYIEGSLNPVNNPEIDSIIKENKAKSKSTHNINQTYPSKSTDEAYLLYYLSNNNSQTEVENENFLEEAEEDKEIQYNSNSNFLNLNISPSGLEHLMKIDLDSLYNEYFTKDINSLSLLKLEKMYNDFKILLMTLDNITQKTK